MKKGPLSKKEKKIIVERQKDDAESIANELNRSVAVIEKFRSTLEEEESAISKAGDLMARNKRYGVVTMTEGASMASDESRKGKKDKAEPLSPRLQGSIHRFREE